MQQFELPERVRAACASAAKDAMPELRYWLSDERGRAHKWGVAIHALGHSEVIQHDALIRVHQPSVGVTFDPKWSEADLASALERAWAADWSRMAEYPVGDVDDLPS